jgi:DNA-binding NtrC family response regulator
VSPELDSIHLHKALALAQKAAATPGLPVLIVAEAGSPTEALARLIHERGLAASENRFVVVRCRGVPEPVIESELFGNTIGAHAEMRDSAVSRARPGTLFIDQVSELGGAAQARLLSLVMHREKRNIRDSRRRAR